MKKSFDNCSELSEDDFDLKKMEFIHIIGNEIRKDDYFSMMKNVNVKLLHHQLNLFF